MAKQVTMICELVFDVPDDVNVDTQKFDVVEGINEVLQEAGFFSQPQINPNAPMVVTAIEPIE